MPAFWCQYARFLLAAVEMNAATPPGGFNLANGELHKATALAFQAGTDMLMKNTSQLRTDDLSVAELDMAVRRVLRARFRWGAVGGGGCGVHGGWLWCRQACRGAGGPAVVQTSWCFERGLAS